MGDNRTLELTEDSATSSELIFYVNGNKIVEHNPNPDWTLLYYLRTKLRLCGTKEACGEGGCGACTLLQSRYDAESKKIINEAINACLTPLCSVHGTAIITVEGIGSIQKGLHLVQERIAKSHGTQCGFCTSGFVMSMYALLRNNPEPTEQELEDAFQGNLCRCTGYRPILAGYKTFCKKTGPDSSANGCCGGLGKNGRCCMEDESKKDTTTEVAETLFDESEFKKYDPSQDIIFPSELQLNTKIRKQSLLFKGPNVLWMKPSSLEELLKLKAEHPNAKFIGGNTEVGIEIRFKQQYSPMIIQIPDLNELQKLRVENNCLVVGGAVTLSKLKDFCSTMTLDREGTVSEALQEMLHWFAGPQIRNVATLAGNIITASPISDLNPILIACGAICNFVSIKDGKRSVKMDESFFPKYRTTIIKSYEILESVCIPLTKENEYVWAVKQAKRREDDIAIVNACMKVIMNPSSYRVEDALLVFGGMAPTTKISKRASKYLIGRDLNQSVLDEASDILFEEMKLEPDAPGGMVAYRQILVQSFFKKFYIAIQSWHSKTASISSSVSSKELCVVQPEKYEGKSGIQLYQIVPKSQKVEDLVGRPIVHLSALKHATGEAVYTDDEIPIQGQLYGAFVSSPIAHGKILSIDASKALAMPGVVDFVYAKSISQENNITGFMLEDEEIFASEYVYCQGQTIGIIVADDALTAERAAKMVDIKFEELTPIITMEDAIEKESFHAIRFLKSGDIETGFEEAEEFLEGEMRIGGQEHFYMETQACTVTPKEDKELDILMSCQGPDYVQKAVAKALKIPASRVKVRCRRMGGAFGGKESRCNQTALPIVMAAVKLRKSIRFVTTRWEDMVATGGRHPFLFRYKVGFMRNGRILGVKGQLFSNAGYSWDTSPVVLEKAMLTIEAAYTIPHWDITGKVCKTNLHSNTAFRGYGGPQASIFMESVIDAVAEKLGKSPVEIRHMHLKQDNGDCFPIGIKVENCTVRRCWEECVRNSNYEERRKSVEEFNSKNKWKKRGITVMPMKHDVGFHLSLMNQAGALVMIYSDGSVGLNHGGTEMGQGLHTKMSQVASRALGGVALDKIYFMETSTDKVPNATATCGSFSSDLNGMAVKDACEKLAKRLEPFKKANPAGTWEDWVAAAYANRTNLSAVGFFEVDMNYDFSNPKDLSRDPYLYTVYGVGVSEVEVDCLTGGHTVLRTDLVVDAGESLNPSVDIGQIEGAFIQGYGLFTMEELLYSPNGLMLTRGPGMYKIPSMGDIPRQFNVSLLRGAPNPKAVYSSKGLGEPPLFLAASVYFAIKEAIKAARKEQGLTTLFRLDCPATPERIRIAFGDETVIKVKEKMEESRASEVQSWAVTV